jgi:hypothetical protein
VLIGREGWQTAPRMAAAREIAIADDPAAWERLGFAPDADGVVAIGGLRVRLAGREAGRGVIAVGVEGLGRAHPDGLPVVPAGPGDPRPAAAHPNGAVAIDHLVAFTDDRDRTAGDLVAAGGDLRRRAGPPALPAPMAFVRFGELVVEVAEAGGPPRFWGLTVTVPDLGVLAGPLLAGARDAVQPGRRIATVRREAGLSVALALMSS